MILPTIVEKSTTTRKDNEKESSNSLCYVAKMNRIPYSPCSAAASKLLTSQAKPNTSKPRPNHDITSLYPSDERIRRCKAAAIQIIHGDVLATTSAGSMMLQPIEFVKESNSGCDVQAFGLYILAGA